MQRFPFSSVLWYIAIYCTWACPVILKDDTLWSSKATGQKLEGFRKLPPVQNIQLCMFQSKHINLHPHLRNLPMQLKLPGILYKRASWEQQTLCVPGGRMRWRFQWQTPNDSTSFHDLRVLTSRTWCESPQWRICLWGGLIYLFFRAYNQVRQQCKALGDVVFFRSILHNTTLHVSEWGWSGRPCKGPVTLWERQNTSWRGRRYVPLRCSARDGQHPGRQPYSVSIPYSVTLFFLCCCPFPLIQATWLHSRTQFNKPRSWKYFE